MIPWIAFSNAEIVPTDPYDVDFIVVIDCDVTDSDTGKPQVTITRPDFVTCRGYGAWDMQSAEYEYEEE